MKKHFKAPPLAEGYTRIVDRGNSDLTLIEMGRLYLSQVGATFRGSTGDREVGFNLLSGIIRLQVHSEAGAREFAPVGKRRNAFDGPPTMVYLPIRSEYTIEVLQGPFEAVVYSAPATQAHEPRVVGPEEIVTVRTGELNWTRYVRQGVAANVRAQRLIMGETLAPSGNWSSYPPHKHDEEQRLPFEQPAEEVYSFYFDRPQGFGFIRLYTPPSAPDPFDEAYTFCDGDVITVARGYHPVTVAPGYRCLYLFCLAGEERLYGAWSDDPDHAWLRGCETVVRGNELG